MPPIIIVDNEFITLKYLSDKKIVYHTIHQPFGGQMFRDALLAGTEALKENKACKWLSDDRKNGPLSPEDAAWSFEHWNLPTIEAGWKYWALVVPSEIVAAGSLVPTMKHLFEYDLRMMVFSNLEAAIEWLDGFEC